MFNKNLFKKRGEKKVLHKVKKNWVVISTALLMMIGGTATAAQAKSARQGTNHSYGVSVTATNHTNRQPRRTDSNQNAKSAKPSSAVSMTPAQREVSELETPAQASSAGSSSASAKTVSAKPSLATESASSAFVRGNGGSAASYHSIAQRDYGIYRKNHKLVQSYVNSLNDKFPGETNSLKEKRDTDKAAYLSNSSEASYYQSLAQDPDHDSILNSYASAASSASDQYTSSVAYKYASMLSDISYDSYTLSAVDRATSLAEQIGAIDTNSASKSSIDSVAISEGNVLTMDNNSLAMMRSMMETAYSMSATARSGYNNARTKSFSASIFDAYAEANSVEDQVLTDSINAHDARNYRGRAAHVKRLFSTAVYDIAQDANDNDVNGNPALNGLFGASRATNDDYALNYNGTPDHAYIETDQHGNVIKASNAALKDPRTNYEFEVDLTKSSAASDLLRDLNDTAVMNSYKAVKHSLSDMARITGSIATLTDSTAQADNAVYQIDYQSMNSALSAYEQDAFLDDNDNEQYTKNNYRDHYQMVSQVNSATTSEETAEVSDIRNEFALNRSIFPDYWLYIQSGIAKAYNYAGNEDTTPRSLSDVNINTSSLLSSGGSYYYYYDLNSKANGDIGHLPAFYHFDTSDINYIANISALPHFTKYNHPVGEYSSNGSYGYKESSNLYVDQWTSSADEQPYLDEYIINTIDEIRNRENKQSGKALGPYTTFTNGSSVSVSGIDSDAYIPTNIDLSSYLSKSTQYLNSLSNSSIPTRNMAALFNEGVNTELTYGDSYASVVGIDSLSMYPEIDEDSYANFILLPSSLLAYVFEHNGYLANGFAATMPIPAYMTTGQNADMLATYGGTPLSANGTWKNTYTNINTKPLSAGAYPAYLPFSEQSRYYDKADSPYYTSKTSTNKYYTSMMNSGSYYMHINVDGSGNDDSAYYVTSGAAFPNLTNYHPLSSATNVVDSILGSTVTSNSASTAQEGVSQAVSAVSHAASSYSDAINYSNAVHSFHVFSASSGTKEALAQYLYDSYEDAAISAKSAENQDNKELDGLYGVNTHDKFLSASATASSASDVYHNDSALASGYATNVYIHTPKYVRVTKDACLHRDEDFTTDNRKGSIKKGLRLHVIGLGFDKAGRTRYIVDNDGNKGYITANQDYVTPAYLKAQNNVSIEIQKPISEYTDMKFQNPVKLYQSGTKLNDVNIVAADNWTNGLTMVQLTNGHFIPADTNYMKVINQPGVQNTDNHVVIDFDKNNN